MLTEAGAGRLPPYDLAILRLGLEIGIESIVSGSFHQDIYESAKTYAEAQAKKGKQDGHAGWGARSKVLQRLIPSRPRMSEVTAESWDLIHEEEAKESFNRYGDDGLDEVAEAEGLLIGTLAFYNPESEDIPRAIAKSMFDSWRQSPGHWRIVNGKCTYFGYAVAQSRRNFIGVGIVAF